MKLQREETKGQERKTFRRCAPLAAGIALAGIMAFPSEALGQPKAQCSATVQSGSIPTYHSKGKNSHVVSTPLMQAGKYLSLSIPASHVDKVVKAAKAKPEGQRASFVRDAIHSAIQSALTRLGKGDKTAFVCPSPAVTSAEAPAKAPEAKVKAAPAEPKKPADDKSAPSGERRRTIQLTP